MNAVPKLPKVLGSFPSPAPTKSSRRRPKTGKKGVN
jgi:hypothetical protein